MLNRTKIVLIMLVIAMLATPWAMVGTAVAQKAEVPKPQDNLAIGEDEAKQLLLLIDTDKKGKIQLEFLGQLESECRLLRPRLLFLYPSLHLHVAICDVLVRMA